MKLYYSLLDWLFQLWLRLTLKLFYKDDGVTTWNVYYTRDSRGDCPMEVTKIKTLNYWPPNSLFRIKYPGSKIHKFHIVDYKRLKKWESSKKLLKK